MGDFKREFIEFMLGAGALRFGDFTTKSGRKTPYFINTGAYVGGSQMARLGEFYAKAIHSVFGDGVDNLFGPAYKGIPLAVTASMAIYRLYGREVTYTFNRKEVKDHGEGGEVVGYSYAAHAGQASAAGNPGGTKPCRVVIIEDVTTAGTSVRESLPLIRAHAGVEVVGLVVSVDRMERGRGSMPALREIETEFGLKTAAIVSLADIIAYLESEPGRGHAQSDSKLLDRMKAYLSEWG